ncbi:MAG: DEAD/DEAH box helicase family protein, partial [Burkholderiales bacterium]
RIPPRFDQLHHLHPKFFRVPLLSFLHQILLSLSTVSKKCALNGGYFTTYPTMLNIIRDEAQHLSPHFLDFIVVDESHRFIYNTFGEVLEVALPAWKTQWHSRSYVAACAVRVQTRIVKCINLIA